jgi:Zn-finger domain-containing protein
MLYKELLVVKQHLSKNKIEMDVALEQILVNTYNPNSQLRLAAEQALQQFLITPGSLTALLQCIGNRSIHREIRQATGLVMKNRLRDYWSTDETARPKALPSSPEERELIKDGLVQVLLDESDNSIRNILAESIRVVGEYEFPQR